MSTGRKTNRPAPPPAPPSLHDFAAAEDKARFAENQELARSSRAARLAARDAAARVTELEAELELFRAIGQTRSAPPTWLAPAAPGKGHRAIPSLVVGDVHWGETVDPAQVEEMNMYNLAIAEMRMRRAFEGTVMLCRDYLAGVDYDGVTLFLTGDMISGDIHEELRETNAQTVAESVLGVVEPLEAGINLLVEEFGSVHVAGVPGNHPRGTKKPSHKKRARDNFDTMVYRVIERDYRRAADTRVTVDVATGADLNVKVYGTRYLLTHGDQFNGGSGIAGALSPLLLGAHRKTRRQAKAGRPYDTMVMGHWHQSLWFPSKGVIVSGCVKGYDEYAYDSNFEPEDAQCALWLTTPERGITVSAPVFVQDRTAEGW